MKNFKKVYSGFTIVELLVVITILAILGTVGYISYVSYVSTSRDATRVSQLQLLNQAFESYTNGKLPLPDNKATVYANGTVIGYQGYAGENVLSDLGINDGGKDPLDNTYYTYFIDNTQKYVQLLTFLEDETESISYNGIINQANATDYSERFPKPYGSKLGVLVESGTNNPIQDISALVTSGLDVVSTTSSYIAFFTQDDYLSGSGGVLQKLQQTIWHDGIGLGAPKSCPEGFLRVPGNIEFNQPGFCVMKYEATYEDATVPDSTNPDSNWNTMHYQVGKSIVSKPGLYPITEITQQEAITACENIGDGYHLITNDEWMTIARNIEQVGSNWSGNSIGSGGLYRGITRESNSDTSLGCATSNSSGSHSRTYGSTPLYSDTSKWGSNKGSDCDSKRQHILSNGEIIWDLSGNNREHVNGANTLNGTNFASMQGNICGGNEWYSFAGTDGASGGTCTFLSPYSYATQGPKTLNLNANNGIGRLNSFSPNSRIFLRGGDSDILESAGIFSLDLRWMSSDYGNSFGFRCAK